MGRSAGTNRSDRELADSIIETGSERAFRELYRRHTPRLMAFVARITGANGDDREDLVQETWIRACDALRTMRWESAFSSWLLGIGLNVSRDWLRQNGHRKQELTAGELDRPNTTSSDDDRIDLERAIAQLDDDLRLVLVLHDVEGLKHHEIAERLTIAVGTSKSRLFEARKNMRILLSRSGGILNG